MYQTAHQAVVQYSSTKQDCTLNKVYTFWWINVGYITVQYSSTKQDCKLNKVSTFWWINVGYITVQYSSTKQDCKLNKVSTFFWINVGYITVQIVPIFQPGTSDKVEWYNFGREKFKVWPNDFWWKGLKFKPSFWNKIEEKILRIFEQKLKKHFGRQV